jgi:hypothetical protein
LQHFSPAQINDSALSEMKSADNKQNPPVERAGVSFSEKNIEKKLASNNKEAGGTFTFEDGSVHRCWKYNIWLQHAW